MKRKTPIVKTLKSSGHSAAELFRALAERNSPGFIWESSDSKSTGQFFSIHTPGRYSYLAVDIRNHYILHGLELKCFQNGCEKNSIPVPNSRVFDEVMSESMSDFHDIDLPDKLSLPPFIGGVVGVVSYDAVRYVENIKGLEVHEDEPEFFLMKVDRFLVIDHELDQLSIVYWPRSNTDECEEAVEAMALLLSQLPEPVHAQYERPETPVSYKTRHSESVFTELVARAKEYIAAGDIFQVVLGHTAEVKKRPDPLALYEYLRQHNQSPYHYFMSYGDSQLVGASPEVMLQGVAEEDGTRRVFMRPVAGTYPRSNDVAEDEKLALALRNDEKEQAEHIMLVDLERNDIGRVSDIGTVTVKDLLSVESYGKVHHLVSEVSGVLKEEASLMDALESCFPIGTLAGAPKIRAMEIIAELERIPRGTFGGAVVMQGANDVIDSCVAIRNALCTKELTIVRAGAGIVQDSDPAREHRECLWKAEAVLQGIEAVEEIAPQ